MDEVIEVVTWASVKVEGLGVAGDVTCHLDGYDTLMAMINVLLHRVGMSLKVNDKLKDYYNFKDMSVSICTITCPRSTLVEASNRTPSKTPPQISHAGVSAKLTLSGTTYLIQLLCAATA